MGERNLKLVADNKPRKRHILLLFACLAVVLGMGIYFLITDFSIQKIQMKHWTACRKVSAMPDWRKMNGCRSSAISRWQI